MTDQEYRELRERYAVPAFPRRANDPPIAPKDGDLGRILVFVDDPDHPDPDYRRLIAEIRRRKTARQIAAAERAGDRELLALLVRELVA